MAEKDSFDGIDLRVNRVPEHLAQLKHIKKLTLTFTDKIVLPEWMDKIQIDELRVKGKISPDEMDALGKRFPKIIIQPTNRKDAAATAVWDSRGHNGVIENKTKGYKMKTKGKKKISGTVSDAAGPLWGANVVEINEQGRIMKATITDSHGHFTLKVVNPKDKIRVSYIGLITVELDMDRKKHDIIMEPNTTIREVDIIKRRRTVNADEFEGLEQTP